MIFCQMKVGFDGKEVGYKYLDKHDPLVFLKWFSHHYARLTLRTYPQAFQDAGAVQDHILT